MQGIQLAQKNVIGNFCEQGNEILGFIKVESF